MLIWFATVIGGVAIGMYVTATFSLHGTVPPIEAAFAVLCVAFLAALVLRVGE